MPSYKAVRKSNRFYYFIKFTLNIYSMLFSLLGLCVLCVGVYAEVERQNNRTLEGVFLAPAVVLILLGLVMFTVSLVGMVGSLRDNKTLLHMFLCVLCVLLFLQVVALIVALIFEKKTSALFQSSIREGIKHYYDDLDFKNILDFVQQKVGEVVNTLCGYKTLSQQREVLDEVIHVRGCIHAVNLWMGDNVGATIGLCCALGLPQLMGIVLSCMFWNLLVEMNESMDMVDFKILKRAGFEYSELDLAGAGCCLCLPRDGGYLPLPALDPILSDPDLKPIPIRVQRPLPVQVHRPLAQSLQDLKLSGLRLDEVDIGRKQKRREY
ncbi:tetraspanin-15-like isoform X2 [Oncorhynchus nerka]|uniref:tetraspanin-15-like isoform X2 n=1 Tax=Oncorhynchus kisutch TaxID=8019 RepID=UPI0009A02B38|nr:tetraspanin-15-like isoform X2 [Oncorhynchus kisutch]XP_029494080.1 tetraspanin-15-like isoform X2 [Oncorhynchus nerka]